MKKELELLPASKRRSGRADTCLRFTRKVAGHTYGHTVTHWYLLPSGARVFRKDNDELTNKMEPPDWLHTIATPFMHQPKSSLSFEPEPNSSGSLRSRSLASRVVCPTLRSPERPQHRPRHRRPAVADKAKIPKYPSYESPAPWGRRSDSIGVVWVVLVGFYWGGQFQ